MSKVASELQEIITRMGLKGASVSVDAEEKRMSITADEGEWFAKMLPYLVRDMKHLANLIARKHGEDPYVVDVNNYRKERERLLVELAKAAAQKAVMTKEVVRLPAMNSYERRLVHVELAMRPDVETESVGEGKERAVIVKLSDL